MSFFMFFYMMEYELNIPCCSNQANDNKYITIWVALPRMAQQIHFPFYPNSRQFLSIPTRETAVSEYVPRAYLQKGYPAVPRGQSPLSWACPILTHFAHRHWMVLSNTTVETLCNFAYLVFFAQKCSKSGKWDQDQKVFALRGTKSPPVTHRVVKRV